MQINIQDSAKEELVRLLESKGAAQKPLRIHVAGVG
jgi:Fe-S cluster assembly iron-binding protein IscA